MTATDVIERVRISDVWSALGGGKLCHGRGRAFWRDGDGFNVSISDDKNCWHDFVANEGGGVLDLVQHVRGCTRAEALRWTADIAGVPLDDQPFSPHEKRVYAVHRQQAEKVAQRCAWWVRARMQELERLKAAAYERDDFDTLRWSSRELFRAEHSEPGGLMERFVKAMRDDPENTIRLVDAGREDEASAYAMAAAVVLMLQREEAARAAA